MAAAKNILQMRGLLSALTHRHEHYFSPVNLGSAQQLIPRASTILTRTDFYRKLQTKTNPAEGSEPDESKNLNSSEKQSAISRLKTSPRHDLAMIFTCKVCETRSVKMTCRESYEKGVVVARCGGCNNLHLIADRLGWFGEPGSIEDYLAARGEQVKRGSEETLSLTLGDLAGTNILTK